MADHPLDQPVWNALTTRQAPFALGGEKARRFPSEVAPFLAFASADDDAGSEGLAIVGPEESPYLMGVAPPCPPQFEAVARRTLIQMTGSGPVREPAGPVEILTLGPADGPDMLGLIAVAYPGYFRPRTPELGTYLGIRLGATLVAMAGERLGPGGYQELSAICTHPDYRGRGYAARLIARLVNRVIDRGLVPFLHTEDDNAAAQSAYARAGFAPRSLVDLVRVRARR